MDGKTVGTDWWYIYIYIQPPKCIQEESINDARALTLARVHNIIYYLC